MRYVPWHVKGVRPEARDAARDAARRSGLSVGAWLNSLIIAAAVGRHRRPASADRRCQPTERRLHDIEARIDALQGSTPCDDIANALVERLEAAQLSVAGEAVLKSFEQRIGTLVEKLANSAAQSDRREGADHRMHELLAQLRELREQNENRLAAIQQQIATSAADAISGPAESIRRDVASLKEIQTTVDRRTQGTFEAVYGTIEQMVDRLAVIEDELRDRQGSEGAAPAMVAEAPTLAPAAAPAADGAAPAPALKSQGEHDWVAVTPSNILSARPSAAAARLRHPAVPDFALDASLEPDSGARRVRVVANAIDRIAASEAVNGIAKPAETSAPVRAKFVAAARRAAQAVMSEHKGTPPPPYPALSPTLSSPASGRGLGRGAGEERVGEKPGPDAAQNFLPGKLFARLRPPTKSVVVGVGMVLLMFGGLRFALDFFYTPAGEESVRSAMPTDNTAQRGGAWAGQSPPDQPPTPEGASLELPTSPVPYNANVLPGETAPGQAPGRAGPPDPAAPAIPTSAATQTPASMPLQATADRDPASRYTSAAASDLTATPLPPTIGGKALLAAASAGDPSACYEIAMRFAQGRNTTQDLAMAAAWLERAARSGLAPAQFRLGSMYEKGLGVRKDLAEARRLYVAAADKGHAKAMHNLAVLHAAGLDGKPDYAVASQWFRRAAAHGIVDSQYNLAILYARGVGIERNLAESYKWFALAAKGGDHDAARKRDEVAMLLDQKQLESAKLNAESFVAVPQPNAATAVNTPPGGWDQAVAAATTKSKAIARPERFPGKQELGTR